MSGFVPLAPAVQDALFEAIAAAAPAEVAVSLGYPAGGLSAEQIWVQGDCEAQVSLETSGYEQREEDCSLEVRIAVLQAVPDFAPVRDRAFALYQLLEGVLAADRTLGGLVDRCSVSAYKGQEAIPDEHQRQYGITVTVTWAGTRTAF